MAILTSPIRFALIFAAVAANFFFISATTFASLGVVLPHMIGEFGWSWAEAGLGFTLLALACGLCSPLPALVIKLIGARGNYGLGAAVMATGFGLLSMTSGLASFWAATLLVGVGFALLANVPGVAVLSEWTNDRARSVAIGAYLTVGALGGVAGPFMAIALIGDEGAWRLFWQFAAATQLALGGFAIMTVARRASRGEALAPVVEGLKTPSESGFNALRQAMVTPQFLVIILALTVIYFCGLTVNSFLPIHLMGNGHPEKFAAVALSTFAAANAASRAIGGLVALKIRVRYLLISGLLAEALAMGLLGTVNAPWLIIAFALLQGYAYGMVLFASTMVQIEYFGPEKSAAMIGFMNMAATTAMLGPVVTGVVGDSYGTFSPVFLVYGAAALLCAVLAMMMHNPEKAVQKRIVKER